MLETVARLDAATCAFEVVQGEWPKPTEYTFHDPHPIVTMSFYEPDYKAEGRYLGFGASQFVSIGHVSLTVPNHALLTRGTGGKMRAARCLFEPEACEDLVGPLGEMTLVQLTNALDVGNANIHLLLRRMMQETNSPGFAGQALIESMGTALLIECVRAIHGKDAALPKGGLDPRHLRCITDYLESVDVGFPTVSDIAQLCGFSTHYFCRMFRQHTGQSVGRFLANWRLQRAEQLLVETDLPLKVIAYKLGFANAANFSTAFRNERQQPPGSYRAERRLAGDGDLVRTRPTLNSAAAHKPIFPSTARAGLAACAPAPKTPP